MKLPVKTSVILLLGISLSWAQRQPLGFLASVKGDSVFLFFNQSPRIGQGFVVERRGPDEADFVRLTESPVNAVMDLNQVRLLLGNDYQPLAAALRVSSLEDLMIKLRTDPYYGQVATLINRSAAKVLGRFFVQAGHRAGAVYQYRVRRLDRSNKVLETVAENVTIQENPPQAVNSLKCRQDKYAVIIDWDYPQWTGAITDVAFQFLLFRSSDGKKFHSIHDQPLLRIEGMPYQYIDKNITMGLSYTYRMVAIDAAGLMSRAAEAVVKTRDVMAPQRPQGMEAKVLKKRVRLTWTRNTEPDLAGYHLYRWLAGQKDSIRINTALLPPQTVTFVDSTATLGEVHYYAVTAVDLTGSESSHSDRAHALVTDKTPPRPPKHLMAEVKAHAVNLHWSPSPDADVKGYQMRRGQSEKGAFRISPPILTDTLFVDRGDSSHVLTAGGRYYYSVVAIDTLKLQSEPVGIWVALADVEPPLAPGKVSALNHLGREIQVTWNPSLSADVARYVISRIAGLDTTTLDTVSVQAERFCQDDKIAKGANAEYRVVAIDTAGNKSKASLSGMVRMRDLDPPTATAYVTAVLVEGGVRIAWEAVGDFDLAGYNVYRSTLPTGVMTKLNTEPLTRLEFVDQDGRVINWYVVRSVDSSGNESQPSQAVKPSAKR